MNSGQQIGPPPESASQAGKPLAPPRPQTQLSRLVLASGNAGKLREFAALFAPYGLDVVPQDQLAVPETPEPHPTFLENALAKARHASLHTGLPALADDSGICVPALRGAPGVHSARYAGEPRSDLRNSLRLVAALQGEPDRRAEYYCVLVLVRHADDPRPLIAEGVWNGQLIDAPMGSGGFGYDPWFLLPELGQTAAELSAEHKNRVSHRAQALKRLVENMLRADLLTHPT